MFSDRKTHLIVFFLFLYFSTSVWAQNKDTDRRDWLLKTVAEERNLGSWHVKTKPYEILAYTAWIDCGRDKGFPQYMANLLSSSVDIFSLPPLVRYLYQFGNCLSDHELGQLRAALNVKRLIFDHGTLNHAMLQATSWYLLAQYFPDAKWRDINDVELSSEQVRKRISTLLIARFNRTSNEGHAEQLSPTYSMINVFPLLNLIDFSSNRNVSQLAAKEANFVVNTLRLASFDGIIIPPINRYNYFQELGTDNLIGFTPAVSQHLLWFYFGKPKISKYDVLAPGEPAYSVMLALSNWRPTIPQVLNNISDYELFLVTPSFSKWGGKTYHELFGKSFFSEEFAIGFGYAMFDPAGYNEGMQLFSIVLGSDSNIGQVECYHPYWRGNLNDETWSLDQASPFTQGWFSRDRGVILFDIPDADPWVFEKANRFFALRSARVKSLKKFLQCRFPTSPEYYEKEGAWMFFRHDKTYFAAHFFGGKVSSPVLKYRERELRNTIRINSARGGVFFRVSKASELSFRDFRNIAKQEFLQYDDSSVSVKYLDQRGKVVKVLYKKPKKMGEYFVSIPSVDVSGEVDVEERFFNGESSVKLKNADAILLRDILDGVGN